MSVVTKIQCDVCDKEASIHKVYENGADKIVKPVGWTMLVAHHSMASSQSLLDSRAADVCGLKCGKEWIAGIMDEWEVNDGGSEDDD